MTDRKLHVSNGPSQGSAQMPTQMQVYKPGLTAGLVVKLIGLLLVFASQKIVHHVRDEIEMAEFVVPLS